jgi:type II secretory pathway predicted ATPase ExeA
VACLLFRIRVVDRDMESTLIDEQREQKEGKKRVPVTGDVGKGKQLYDKTKTVKDKYDKRKSVYDSAMIAKNKVQQGHQWFKNGEVHPTSSTATQQLTTQAAANMVSQSAPALAA